MTYDEGSNRSLSQVEVLTYVVAGLGGADRAVHLEDVAVQAYQIVPGAFRWDLEKYSNLIDKDKVRASLTDAAKSKYGSLVRAVGVTKRGVSKQTDLWRLSSDGAAWVLANEKRIRAVLDGPTPRLKRAQVTRLRKRLTSSPLYEEYQKTGRITPNAYAFTDLIECSPDAHDSVVEQRFDELKAHTNLMDVRELLNFVRACGEAHAHILGDR
ncbi:MAG: hypothetical protein F4Z17_03655 [Acidimicrobiia bacterium]|nr:hypothetical protein [Acidimicrobiia bacterium]